MLGMWLVSASRAGAGGAGREGGGGVGYLPVGRPAAG